MSFFDDASLVMIPSGYKDQKVYSVKPTDGTGDLTFSRASSATRVASNGLIEKVRTNLLLQSNTFNTTWTLDDATLTSGQSGYDGTNNAWRLAKTAAGGRVQQTLSLSSNSHTFSVYVKAGTKNWVFLRTDGTSNMSSYFNLQTGVVGTASGCTPSIVSAGNGWYRCSISYVETTTSARIWVADADTDISGTSGNILIQAAQVETGDIATDYIATTTAAVSVGPVSGLPRLDYLNSTCPRLLLEPQRTNTARNAILTAATWDKSSLTVTAASGIAPTGFNEAYRVAPTTSGTNRFFYDDGGSSGYTASADYTNTIFAKASGLNFCYARFEIKGNTSSFVYFNLATGAVGSTVGAVPIVKSIENYGNGWYRIRVTGNMGTGIGGSNNVLFGVCDADGSTFATASGSNGVLFYGPQSEQGSYPTSYIPTLGASVTRVVDKAEKTSASALIGQTEGTIFWEIQVDIQSASGNEQIFTIDNGSTYDNSIYLAKGETGSLVAVIVVGAVVQATFSVSKTTGTFKMAIGYANNNSAFFVDGVQVSTTDTSCSIPASLSRITLGNTPLGSTSGKTAQVLLFPTRLTNAQLAELTA
jgi:hypothetical protein